MTSGRRPTQLFCIRGHDLTVYRTTSGCRACKRIRDKERWANRGQRPAPTPIGQRVSTMPLRPLLRIATKLQPLEGARGVAAIYAERFGVKQATAEKQYLRILQCATVPVYTADQWAIFLGRHPVELWGDEWEDAS